MKSYGGCIGKALTSQNILFGVSENGEDPPNFGDVNPLRILTLKEVRNYPDRQRERRREPLLEPKRCTLNRLLHQSFPGPFQTVMTTPATGTFDCTERKIL